MTLVQNLLRPLNGNNLLVILFLLTGTLSCTSKNILSSSKTEVVAIQTKSTETASNETGANSGYEDSISKNPVIFDLDENFNSNNTTNSNTTTNKINNDPNRINHVAVILPFYLDQIPLGQYADDTTKQLGADSKNAMEFYLGCQMAREKFESEHLNTNVYFLDDRNDSLTLTSLFKLKPFPNVDFIIGPLYPKNIKIAAELASQNQIPLISPLANSMYINTNPYYFNAFASLKTQYSYILEQTKAKFPGKTLEVLYDASDSTAESIDLFKTLTGNFETGTIKYKALKATDDAATALRQTDTSSERIIIIYSSKETYIKSVILKLKPLKNHLQIFTSSVVKNTKQLTDSKNPHTIYTAYPFNTDNPNFTVFAARYEEKYKKKTSEFANQGFDIMMHLFMLLDKNKHLQDNIYHYSSDFNNTQTKFRFKPVLNKNGDVDYYDNTFLYLYRYVNGTFINATL